MRKKPIPTDPYSLNQAYQRWDYRDYAYLWTLLSNAEKQVYRTKASRYHITGFSQWMREGLKELTNLAGRWHLDEKGGAIAYDSSKNTNNGIIIGASPTTGLIDGAQSSDGLNDEINFGNPPSLNITDNITIMFFVRREGVMAGWPLLVSKWTGVAYNIDINAATNRPYWMIHCAGGTSFRYWSTALPLDSHVHLAATYSSTTSLLKTYWEGVYEGSTPHGFGGGPILITALPFRFSHPTLGCKASIDELIVMNRVCNETEILRAAQRRYP